MSKLIIKSDAFILPAGLWSGYLVAENGCITALTKEAKTQENAEFIDATGQYVSPGFIDIHTHGGGGHDFMDGGAACIIEGCRAHMKHGTTSIMPTTLASSIEEIYKFLDSFRAAKAEMTDGPNLLGAHFEGPYFNKAQAGAQDPRYIKSPTPEEYKAILQYGEGIIARWSLAPELDGALEMADYLASLGILPAIAHSDAEYDQVVEAYNHHFSLVTHLYSGMSTIVRKGGYRRLGVVESAYLIDDMDVEVIADGHHLPPELLKLIYKHKGPDKIAMVTDSMRAAGVDKPEPFETIIGSLQNGQQVIVEGGIAKMPDRTSFAGSVATADRLVRVMHKSAGVDIVNTVKMLTATPARICGIADKKGSIAVNHDCDLVVFDDDIKVSAVIISGKVMSNG